MIRAPMELPRCDEVSARLSDLLDGELDDLQGDRVALHLATCAACARLARELAVTIRALHGLRARRGPPEVCEISPSRR
jgi:anti-sigma factor RsiW